MESLASPKFIKVLNPDILDILATTVYHQALKACFVKEINQIGKYEAVQKHLFTDLSNSYASHTGPIHSLENSTPPTTTLTPSSYR